MTFNIVYTPNSIQYLSFFIYSLLEYSTYEFRLVSNGCSLKEQKQLKQICQSELRLQFWVVPTKKMLPHGQVLNYLQAISKEAYFCLMDSDIFAINRLPDLAPHLLTHTALFSALPVWVNKKKAILPKTFRNVLGTVNQTHGGTCLGGTYFAVYNNQQLSKLIQSTGIGFEEIYWQEIPTVIQLFLKKKNLNFHSYDTGKLLNILLGLEDYSLVNLEISSLCHIGGSSFEINNLYRTEKKQNLKQNLKNQLKQLPILQKIIQSHHKNQFQKRNANASEEEIAFNLEQRWEYRDVVREYFMQLYLHLTGLENQPNLPKLADLEILTQLKKASKNYVDNFRQFYNSKI